MKTIIGHKQVYQASRSEMTIDKIIDRNMGTGGYPDTSGIARDFVKTFKKDLDRSAAARLVSEIEGRLDKWVGTGGLGFEEDKAMKYLLGLVK